MQLPDGTAADVVALDHVNNLVTARVQFTYPGGTQVTAWVAVSPTFQVTSGAAAETTLQLGVLPIKP